MFDMQNLVASDSCEYLLCHSTRVSFPNEVQIIRFAKIKSKKKKKKKKKGLKKEKYDTYIERIH